MIRSYRDLVVWQRSFQLAIAVYRFTKDFPKEETYGLTAQIRRAAISIPSNIAEGNARQRKLEYIQFLQFAFGSGAELETQLLIAKEIGFLSSSTFGKLQNKLSETMMMLNALISKLKRK